ncbi:HPr family phosphocarrier protein [Candidatus Woesearchaeota archaeon]|nr:HPr family phosphocarrier protein [Candidatus Woesearchaeota archaeon]
MNMQNKKDMTLDDKLEEVYVVGRGGIHARPSALIAAACQTYPLNVNFFANDHEAKGTSTLSLLCLGASPGDVIKVDYSLPEIDHENYIGLINQVKILENYISEVIQAKTSEKFESYVLKINQSN